MSGCGKRHPRAGSHNEGGRAILGPAPLSVASRRSLHHQPVPLCPSSSSLRPPEGSASRPSAGRGRTRQDAGCCVSSDAGPPSCTCHAGSWGPGGCRRSVGWLASRSVWIGNWASSSWQSETDLKLQVTRPGSPQLICLQPFCLRVEEGSLEGSKSQWGSLVS